ncbi:GDSL-type esterase/lipase family protein [Pontibacter actiniarum]|uniref:T9SS C-terminal target domain-containing protein n=1 Tax=Pontibacter actiniarum TaxID=323450 RepID=A0A1X9YUK3_9BACT|nr:GDSL-type esterase/lipase family protein [Pontibacter actiniarum]ARS36474.1 T9SS C-terminal target domain-containing protein [Pontibacter actiniarum]
MAPLFSFIHFYLFRYLLVFFFASIAIPSTAQYKIMCLGNSITQGNLENPGYRYRLWQKLLDKGNSIELVGSHDVNEGGTPAVKGTVYRGQTYTNRNEGHWGWTADEVLNGRDGKGNLTQWLQSYNPDIALVHLGTNDMFKQCSGGVSPDKACYQETINELKTVIQQIQEKNPNVIVLVAQLIPAYDQKVGPETASNISELNKRIPALAEELSTVTSRVVVVDQNTGFDATTGVDTWDGVHPNASGEEKMAQIWFGAIQEAITPLPVELSSFSAQLASEGHVQLHWQTATEKNNAYFEVQRSTDGRAFAAIGRVAGAGTTVSVTNYTFTDSAATEGGTYYRLKQVDTDGTSSTSKVVQVQVPERAQALQVYPTSSNGGHSVSLHLQHSDPTTDADLHVFTSDGKLVHLQEDIRSVNGVIRALIPIHRLAGAGLYLVRIATESQTFQSEFIVER